MISWLPALGGGVMIGAAALLLYAGIGHIAGISGIAYGALLPNAHERAWRALFVAGLIAGGWLATLLFAALPAAVPATSASVIVAVLAGLLTGVGTRLGNGCTSGHGVCGLARLSPRSLVSVIIFMGVGMLAATWLRPVLL